MELEKQQYRTLKSNSITKLGSVCLTMKMEVFMEKPMKIAKNQDLNTVVYGSFKYLIKGNQ